ncbi:hypothetical protein SAMN04515656_10340 [Eubacterium aggregans]|uniref:Uncharacterized protein n=1 Tax=Eubacterium aggregans TaxID=81409 RepID=A0A1H3Y526_9FIRM|nr:hypothetical protein [Eubacterium aggregans]SEA05922.1 hypothetical protein SAMN04515656_10340 [Eubacterium aggregans]
MENYCTYEQYRAMGYTTIPDVDAPGRLMQSSRNIDSLTFNRIPGGGGIEALTSYQEDVVRQCTAQLADYYYNNQSIIESALSAYSINGVSVNLTASPMIEIRDGVVIPSYIMSFLEQSGLCCLNVDRW